ncbi:BURP domain protein RD22-like isoform X2 [Syzygium oleosum]|uniref:BURP domain protein RD22-like isoform X2 n=1 Tax=Syzygium oleosum TaxID=219896 RepID=UPI0024BAC261|nr:BURP domain protein RD22-like isoform X2 [Syzygium oleosum]
MLCDSADFPWSSNSRTILEVLPYTQMPKSIKDVLQQQSDFMGNKTTSVDVGKGGVNVDVDTGSPGKGSSVGVGKGGGVVHTGHKGKPVYVVVKPRFSPFIYNYAASETQLRDARNVALFFLEKDLKPGTTMTLHFTKTSDSAAFLPCEEAKTLPFSSDKLPDIQDHFSLKPGSVEAEIMKDTIKECEEAGIKGEEKYCTTSLESMIDYTKSKLGNNVKAISTEVNKGTQLEIFTINAGARRVAADESVVCHKQNYPYAVFYCHKTQRTRFYVVPMKGADGTEAKAIAACHPDTSAWNPKHLAFQVLKVKPGTVPVCHFLPEDHIVWFHN